MAATAQGLSGYAGTSGTEYVAESFFSWLKGELRIDHRLQELFDSKCQTRPTDAGTWKDDETSSGSVRISSLHGKNAPENLKIATYLTEKHSRKPDLIPKRSNVKTPSGGQHRHLYRERTTARHTGTCCSRQNPERKSNIKTVCIIKDRKDVLLKRAEILRDGVFSFTGS